MRLNLIFGLLLLIVIAPSAFADNGEKRQNVPLNIIHTVTIGGVPTTSASCNVTVFDPDNNILVLSGIMTPNSTSRTYNYTLSETQNSKIGNVCYDAFCAQGSFNSTERFCIPVTTTGKEYTTADSITNFFIIFVSIALFVFFIWGAIKTPVNYGTNEYNEMTSIPIMMRQLRLFLIVMSYITFVWLTFVLYNLTLGYSQLQAISDFFWFVHRFFISALIPAVVLYIIFGIVSLGKDLADFAKVRRGLGLEVK